MSRAGATSRSVLVVLVTHRWSWVLFGRRSWRAGCRRSRWSLCHPGSPPWNNTSPETTHSTVLWDIWFWGTFSQSKTSHDCHAIMPWIGHCMQISQLYQRHQLKMNHESKLNSRVEFIHDIMDRDVKYCMEMLFFKNKKYIHLLLANNKYVKCIVQYCMRNNILFDQRFRLYSSRTVFITINNFSKVPESIFLHD